MIGFRKMIAKAIYFSGGWRAYRSGAWVLFYHGIAERLRDPWLEADLFPLADFCEQLDYLQRHRRVVPLPELLSLLAEGKTIDSRSTAICFDDALASLSDYAVPELAARRMPFTVGVPAGLPESGRSLWEYEAAFLIHQLDARNALGEFGQVMRDVMNDPATGSPAQQGAFDFTIGRNATEVAARLKRFLRFHIRSDQRIIVLDRLIKALQPDLCERLDADGRFRLMRWGQLRDVGSVGGTLAAHGFLHHPHNASLAEPCQQLELSEPLKLIKRHTSLAVDCFIWPEGVSNSDSIKIGTALGYKYFLSTQAGWISKDTSPVNVPRLSGQWPISQLLWNSAGLR